MMDTIGYEAVALAFERKRPDAAFTAEHLRAIAAVHRLTPDQAIAALCRVIGRDVDLAARALEYATDGEYRAAACQAVAS